MDGTQTALNIGISYFPSKKRQLKKVTFISPAVNRWRYQYQNKHELFRIIITKF
jgi:hypothetical protein